MQVYYLEIVTTDVDAVCATYAQLHGVSFSEPEAGLGNARTASLSDGGKIGVRAPMHEAEEPVVRPYLLVDDIEAAAKAAVESGGEIAASTDGTSGPRHLRDLHTGRHPAWCLAALIVALNPKFRRLCCPNRNRQCSLISLASSVRRTQGHVLPVSTARSAIVGISTN